MLMSAICGAHRNLPNPVTRRGLSAWVLARDLRGAFDLPLTGQALPDSVANATLGVGNIYNFSNGMTMIYQLGVESESDELFHSEDEIDLSGEWFLTVPSGERNRWIFGINWGFRNQIIAGGPLPIVAYTWVVRH